MNILRQQNNTRSRDIQDKLNEFNRQWKSGITQIKTILQKNWPKRIRSKNSWYIVIGDKGEGKSSLLQASDSLVPIECQTIGMNNAGIEHLGFWMMQDSVILDTPGEMIEQNGEAGAVLWCEFLQQIKRSQNRNSINGVILCISADTLRHCNVEKLQQKGDNIGKRLIEMTHMLNIQCPVYVLVTKCNKLDDQQQYFQSFPIAATKQVMGKLYQVPHKEMRMSDVVSDAVHYIYDQLNILRLVNLRRKDFLEKNDHNLFFPEKLKMLKRGLATLLQPIFIFDEAMGLKFGVHLRGVFFTSVDVHKNEKPRPENSLSHNFMNNNNKGFFLQELFTVVLPGDKGLFSSTQPGIMDFVRRYNKIFSIWFSVLVIVLTIGFLNYLASSEKIEQLENQLSEKPDSKDSFEKNMLYLNKMRKTILSLETEYNSRGLIGFSTSSSYDLANILKIEFTRRFYTTIYQPAIKYFDRSIVLIEDGYLPRQINVHQRFLSNKIELLSHAINGSELRQLVLFVQPDYKLLLKDRLNIDANKYIDLFTQNYLAYLVWVKDKKLLKSELLKDTLLLKKLLKKIRRIESKLFRGKLQ